jgi:glucarate dehydratase
MIEAHDARVFEGKIGAVGLEEELHMMAEVRAAIGSRPLQPDANDIWTLPTARLALRRLMPFEITWLEEPCESYEEMVALRQHFDLSISTHVIDLPKAARLGCPDAIVTNINELGGVRGAMDFVAGCAAMGVGFRFHSEETGVGTAAHLLLSAALEHVRGASQTLLRWCADDVIEGGPFVPRSGMVTVPDGPGLGVTIDPVALQRCHERYLAEGRFPTGASAPPGSACGGTFRKI